MGVETYYYFLIVLGGFATVWSFRKGSKSKHPISDFEYLGFSTFWGIILVGGYAQATKAKPEALTTLISNPFAAALVLSVIGGILGWAAGVAVRSVKDVWSTTK